MRQYMKMLYQYHGNLLGHERLNPDGVVGAVNVPAVHAPVPLVVRLDVIKLAVDA